MLVKLIYMLAHFTKIFREAMGYRLHEIRAGKLNRKLAWISLSWESAGCNSDLHSAVRCLCSQLSGRIAVYLRKQENVLSTRLKPTLYWRMYKIASCKQRRRWRTQYAQFSHLQVNAVSEWVSENVHPGRSFEKVHFQSHKTLFVCEWTRHYFSLKTQPISPRDLFGTSRQTICQKK